MVSILNQRCIRLTNFLYMNDYLECRWLDHLIHQANTNKGSSFNGEYLNQFWGIYLIRQIYLACFSANGDLLSQWRAYADDGRGVALGFNADRLGLRRGIAHTNSSAQVGMGLHKVLYSSIDHEEIVGFLMREASSAVDNAKRDPSFLANFFRGVAPLIKNPAFAEEQEWRVICLPMITINPESTDDIEIFGAPSSVQFMPKRDSLCPFFTLNFPEDEDTMLNKIIMGPKNRTDHHDLRMFIHKAGYRNVLIERSAATYR